MKKTYPAKVTTNTDDEKRGRIKIACAHLLGDEDTELPMWVEPVLDWGWFFVPDVGETVDVEVEVASDSDEIRGQTSINDLDIRWKGKRYYTDDVPQDPNTIATSVHPDFKDSYGKRRGFATPFGHIFMFDDTEASPTIWLTWQKVPLKVGTPPVPLTYTRLEIEKDGSVKMGLLDKHLLHIQTDDNKFLLGLDKEVLGDYQHTIELDASAPKVEVSLAKGDHKITMDGTAGSVGAQVSLAKGDHKITMDGESASMNVEVSLDQGAHKVTLDGAAPSLEVNLANGNHNIKLNNGQFTANVDSGASIDVSGKDGDAVTTLGDGAVSGAIAEHLKTYIDSKMKTKFDAHIHPTGMGPSGTPTVPMDAYDDAITSDKFKHPDN